MSASGPLVYLIAGEPSGDQLGALLMQALRDQTGGAVRFVGIGGPRMIAAGMESLFPMSDLALMGLEIVPKLPLLLRRIRETVADIRARRPDVLVTIDAQGFSKRIGKALKGAPFPIVQYVAPTVWAWKPWRARTVSRYLTHLLTIFPFEAPFFDRHGLANTFVGHPAAENARRAGDRAGLRARLGIPADGPVLCALPGSRRGEIRRHLPVFRATLVLLKQRFPDLVCIVPTVPNVADTVEADARTWPVPTHVLRVAEDKYDAFAAADAALAASGTVTSECAFAGLPTIVMYKINQAFAQTLRFTLKSRWVKYASAINLVADREILPEYLQHHCTPEALAAAVGTLLADPAAHSRQVAEIRAAVTMLAVDGERPSRIAARTILDIVSRWRESHGSR